MDCFYKKIGKRVFDFTVAMSAMLLLSPIFIAIAAVIKIGLGGPVLFCQERPGKNGRVFKMYKFRSMTDARDESGVLLPDSERLTLLGKWLRSTSLDELPELWNVIWGEMSFVGPRPLLKKYLPRYTPEQAKRHHVLPGLTGLAQVKGRNSLSWEEKFEYDIQYTDKISFVFDLKILIETIFSVIKRQGVSSKGYATMPEFKGTSDVPVDRHAA